MRDPAANVVYQQKELWKLIVENGMAGDVSLTAGASKYQGLYDRASEDLNPRNSLYVMGKFEAGDEAMDISTISPEIRINSTKYNDHLGGVDLISPQHAWWFR